MAKPIEKGFARCFARFDIGDETKVSHDERRVDCKFVPHKVSEVAWPLRPAAIRDLWAFPLRWHHSTS